MNKQERKELRDISKMLKGPCVFHVQIRDIKSDDIRVEYAFNTMEEAQEYINRAINWDTQVAVIKVTSKGTIQ